MHHNVIKENLEVYSEKIISGIYIITAVESGKFYIGSAVNFAARWSVHRHQLKNGSHANLPLLNAYRKYGEDGLSFKILERVEDVSKLIEREQHWMDTLKPQYNINPTAKSRLGAKASDESREKMRKAAMGRKWTNAQRDKFILANRGRPKPALWILNRIGRPKPKSFCIKMSMIHKGKVLSAETRAKISATKRANALLKQ